MLYRAEIMQRSPPLPWVAPRACAKSARLMARCGDKRLQQLDKAAERARVAARVESLPELDEGRLQGACDVVLVDAPCSSSGVLRRHPG